MTTPKVIRTWISEEGANEDDMRLSILRSLQGFAAIRSKATSEEGWISFKLGCSMSQARAAIKWAKENA